MIKYLLPLLVVVSVLFTGTAMAQDSKTVYSKKTVVDFSDVTIEGELVKPEGSYIATRKASRFNKLIKVRENFNPEMVKSVDYL